MLGGEQLAFYRFYYSQDSSWRQTWEFKLSVVLAITLTPLCLICLYRLSTSNPGKLYFSVNDSQDPEAEVCVKCSVKKKPFTHHCSRCNACIEMMDHHCFFAGNCVGKYNIKFYFQFIVMLNIGLIYCVFMLFRLFYTQNTVTGLGVQGVTWLIPPSPYTVYAVW